MRMMQKLRGLTCLMCTKIKETRPLQKKSSSITSGGLDRIGLKHTHTHIQFQAHLKSNVVSAVSYQADKQLSAQMIEMLLIADLMP